MKKFISVLLIICVLGSFVYCNAQSNTTILFEATDTSGITSFVRGEVSDITGVGGRDSADKSVYAQITEIEESSKLYNGYFQKSIGSNSNGKWSIDSGRGYFVIEGSILPKNGITFRFTTNGGSLVSGDIDVTDDVWNKFYVVYNFADGKIMNVVNGVSGEWKTTDFGKVINGTLKNAIRLQIISNENNAESYFDDYKMYTTDTLPAFDTPAQLDSTKYNISGSDVQIDAGVTVADIEAAGATVKVFSDNAFSGQLTGDTKLLNGNIIVLVTPGGSYTYYNVVSELDHIPVTLIKEYSDENTLNTMSILRAGGTVEYGIGGKSANDAVGKFTATEMTDASKNFFTNTSVSLADCDGLTVNILVYANESVNGIFFATNGHTRISEDIYNTSLNVGSWNKLTLVYDKASTTSKLYINDVYHSSVKYAIGSQLRVVFTVAAQDFSDGYIYYDDFYIYGGKAKQPPVETTDYTVDGIFINGYADDTVAKFKQKITLAEDDYTVSVYTDKGELCADSDALKNNYSVIIYDGKVPVAKYLLGDAYYKMSNVMLFNNGYYDGSNKFGKGTLELSCDATWYVGSKKLWGVIAQYDDKGNMLKCSFDENTLSGEGEIKASLDITDAKGTVKVMIIDENLKPYVKSKTYTPYASDKIEAATPLYEGYTTKAATFGYDDGIVSDIKLIEILNKNGAKGTFNINSGFLYGRFKDLAVQNGYCSDEQSVYEYVATVYEGHEMSTHGQYHYPACFDEGEIGYTSTGSQLVGKSTEEEVADLVNCVTDLKEWFNLEDDEVIGLSWPQGNGSERSDYESDLLPAIKNAGIKYARRLATGTFSLPNDWYNWDSTCRSPDVELYIDSFISLKNSGELKCFFVNGHTYDFDDAGDDDSKNWTMIEKNIKRLADEGDIWFATMGDIYRYAEALKLVEVTDTAVTNNSDLTVYYSINGANVEIAPKASYNLAK